MKKMGNFNIMGFFRKKVRIILTFLTSSAIFGYNALAQTADKYEISDSAIYSGLYGVETGGPEGVARRFAIVIVIFLAAVTFIIGLIIFIVKKIKRNKKKNVEKNI